MLYLCIEEEIKQFLQVFFIRVAIHSRGLCSHDLITSYRPPFQHHCIRDWISTYEFRGNKNIQTTEAYVCTYVWSIQQKYMHKDRKSVIYFLYPPMCMAVIQKKLKNKCSNIDTDFLIYNQKNNYFLKLMDIFRPITQNYLHIL